MIVFFITNKIIFMELPTTYCNHPKVFVWFYWKTKISRYIYRIQQILLVFLSTLYHIFCEIQVFFETLKATPSKEDAAFKISVAIIVASAAAITIICCTIATSRCLFIIAGTMNLHWRFKTRDAAIKQIFLSASVTAASIAIAVCSAGNASDKVTKSAHKPKNLLIPD